ncbi:MAG: aldo/keto reductase [Asgard group archaeon]|nr:aldo/keto reductase [Asgard group archaeon]
MKYRKMGKLDWQVSALGFGCMRLPTRRKSMLSRVNKEEAIKIIRSAIDQGVNYFDSAYVYHLGASEKVLGEALQDGYREKVHIATKLFMMLVRKPEDFDKQLAKQLERLQTEYIDVYLFHGLNRKKFEQVKEMGLLDKMIEAKEKGLIKHIGFSFHDTLSVFKEIIDYFDWDVCQIIYNYMDTGMQATTEGLKYAHEKGVATVIMGPLKGGLLADPPDEAIDVMKHVKVQRSPIDWALQFLWNLPEISTIISGMSTQEMVDENCTYADKSGVNSLNNDDLEVLQQLADIFEKRILVPCTTCQYCMPCPYGVNIPDNFALLNYLSHEKEGFRRWRVRRRYRKLMVSKSKDLDIENPNGNASFCTRCNECIEKCPQEIQIPDELEKVHAILAKKENISDYYQD